MPDNNEINTKINFKGSTFKKYFKNTSWLFIEKVFRMVFGFFVGILVVRYLGPEKNGMLATSISIVAILTQMSLLGLNSILVRELVKYKDKAANYLGTVFILQQIFGWLVLIVVATVYQVNPELQFLIILIISGRLLFNSFLVIDNYYTSEVKVKKPVIAKITALIFVSLLKIYLISVKASLYLFAIAVLLEHVILGFILFTLIKKYNPGAFKFSFNLSLAKELLSDSWPLLFAGLTNVLHLHIDKVMLNVMLDNTQVGIYDAGVRLVEIWYFVPTVIVTSLFPSIVASREKDKDLFLDRLKKLYSLLVIISLVIIIPINLLSEKIILLVFDERFITAASVLSIYIWSCLPIYLGVASNQYLIAENKTKISFLRVLFGVVVNLALNFILIPEYGIIGAAVATFISTTVATFSIVFFKDSRDQFYELIRAIFFIEVFKKIKKL